MAINVLSLLHNCLLVVNYELFKNFTAVATSGPTHQELPPSSGLTQSGPDPKVIRMSSSFSQSSISWLLMFNV